MATNETPISGGLTPPAATNAVDATQPEAQTVEAPRVLVGLQAGRIVNYVMLDLSIRPLLIVDAFDGTGKVDGVLFFNGRKDNRNHPHPLPTDESGHLPASVVNLSEVDYSEDLAPGSWHWPSKQAVVAAGVDPNAINTVVVALLSPIVERLEKKYSDLLNEKLAETVDNVNKLLDSHSETVTAVLAEVKQPVLGESLKSPAEVGAQTSTAAGTGTAGTEAAENPSPSPTPGSDAQTAQAGS